jgi:MFS family permease
MLAALPSVPPKEERHPGRAPVIDLRLLQEAPKLRPLILIAAVAWFSLATLEGTFARLISHLFKYNQREFGIIFGYESILGIVVQGVILAWIVRRMRPTALLRSAYLTQGVGLALNPFAGLLAPSVVPFALLVVASTLYAIGSSISNPTVNSLCSRLAPDSRQGELFGLLQGARSIGFVAGPLVGGCLFDWHPEAPYFLAGAVCVAAAILVPRIDDQQLTPTASFDGSCEKGGRGSGNL